MAMTDPLDWLDEAENEVDERRAQLRAFIGEVLDARAAMAEPPVTFANLEIDFVKRTVSFKGRKIQVSDDMPIIVFPVLGTEHLIITKDGQVVS